MKGKALCVAFGISAGITILSLVIIALLMYKAGIGDTVVTCCILATYILSNLAAGFFMGKCVESKRFLWGFVAANVYFVFFILMSLGCGNDGTIGILNWILTYSVIAVSGMLGGMFA